MTDGTENRTEALAAAWLRARGPRDVPDSLRDRVRSLADAPAPRRARPTWVLMAAALVALVAIGTVGAVGALLLNQSTPKPSTPPAVSPMPSPTAAASIEPSPDPSSDVSSIQFAGLLDPSHGWVVGRDTFFATADAGASWSPTPLPGPRVGRGVLGATFADPTHGWLATLDSDDLSGRVFDVWRTSDGGRTWQKAVLREGVVFSDTMGNADFSVVGPDHLLLWIEGGMPSGWTSDLYESTDGGATWSDPRTSAEGISGPAAFADATHGVAAGGARAFDLNITSDSGATWHSVRYPLPKGADRQLTTFLGPARFFDDRRGAISAIYSTADLLPTLVILSTADAGETWSVAAIDTENQGPVAFVNATDWLEVTGTSVRETTDAGATWTARPMAHVPGAVTTVSMPDTEKGWAIVADLGCQADEEPTCQPRSLAATTDGWRTAGVLTPSGSASQAWPSTSPDVSGSPSKADVAAAASAVDRYTLDLVRGDYAAAWAYLAPKPLPWSLASFVEERKAFFASVGGKYTVIPQPGGVAPITDWVSGMHGAQIDLRHAVLVEVSYPALSGNNAGLELFIVVPGGGPDGLVIYGVR